MEVTLHLETEGKYEVEFVDFNEGTSKSFVVMTVSQAKSAVKIFGQPRDLGNIAHEIVKYLNKDTEALHPFLAAEDFVGAVNPADANAVEGMNTFFDSLQEVVIGKRQEATEIAIVESMKKAGWKKEGEFENGCCPG